MNGFSRRGFLRRLLFGLKPVFARQTLVCIFLRGGADTLNIVVPYGDDQYYALRPTLAIAAPKNDNGGTAVRLDDFYGFHPKMLPLLPAFHEGRLGIIQSVGSDNPTGSHFEAQDQMEHGEEYATKLGGGWLARHLRTRQGGKLTPFSAVAIDTSIPESLRGAPTATAMQSMQDLQINTPTGQTQAVVATLEKMYGAEVGILGQHGRETLQLLKRVEQLRQQQYQPRAGVVYPANSFGKGLLEIARLVKARLGLEVACIDLGNWDTHFFQGTSDGLQASNIDTLARGIAAFDADLHDYRREVTTIVITEFGRRIYENGSLGTDHGRGFAFMALGERIAGGQIHGEWPGLDEEEGPGPGGLKVLVDYRNVLAETIREILGNSAIAQIFPGLEYKPVGFVKTS